MKILMSKILRRSLIIFFYFFGCVEMGFLKKGRSTSKHFFQRILPRSEVLEQGSREKENPENSKESAKNNSVRSKSRQLLFSVHPYKFTKTTIRSLVKGSPYLGIRVVDELKLLCTRASFGESIRILDWGCGNGGFLRSIGDLFGEKSRSIKKYGFTIDNFEGTEANLESDSSIKIAHTDLKAFERGLRLMQKQGKKFDLIFSHYGLIHLNENLYYSHLLELLKTTNVGGKIIIFPVFNSKQRETITVGGDLTKHPSENKKIFERLNPFYEKLRKAGINFTVEYKDALDNYAFLVITRRK
jgi:SAM-dependent methyltransferase